MWPTILILAVFIVFALILGFMFLIPLIVVGGNLVILYFLFLRVYTEITKYKRGELYVLSGAAAIFLLLIIGNFLPLWWITTASLLAFAIAQVYSILIK
jgi:hypothetical protein